MPCVIRRCKVQRLKICQCLRMNVAKMAFLALTMTLLFTQAALKDCIVQAQTALSGY